MDDLTKLSVRELTEKYGGTVVDRVYMGVGHYDDEDRRKIIDVINSELERRTRPVHPAGAVGEALDRWQRVAKGESLRSVYDRPNEAWSYNRTMEYAADDNAILAAAFAAQFKGKST